MQVNAKVSNTDFQVITIHLEYLIQQNPPYPTLFGLAPDIAELSKYQKIYSQNFFTIHAMNF